MQYAELARALRRVALAALFATLAGHMPLHAADVHAQLVPLTPHPMARSAVIWLEPVQHISAQAIVPGKFTLLQKNRMFSPHLLVVPVGSSVAFPNADPFFHNVFSLFDGKRFDLGLYEAGSTRTVVFSREGVSYIFCNIHSEMSAVVIALGTPFYSVADQHGTFRIAGVPDGDYDLRVWAEGQPQSSLDRLTERLHIAGTDINLGTIHAGKAKQDHLNKFGRPYDPNVVSTY